MSFPHLSNTHLKDATTYVRYTMVTFPAPCDDSVINSADVPQGKYKETALTVLCQRMHTISLVGSPKT